MLQATEKLATLAKAGEPGQVQPQIAAGLKALGQGDLAQAEGQYLARLKTHAKDPDALGGLGLVRMQQNRWEESAALLTQATQQKNGQNWGKALQSTRYQLLIEQGTSAQREGDLAQARSLLQRNFRAAHVLTTSVNKNLAHLALQLQTVSSSRTPAKTSTRATDGPGGRGSPRRRAQTRGSAL